MTKRRQWQEAQENKRLQKLEERGRLRKDRQLAVSLGRAAAADGGFGARIGAIRGLDRQKGGRGRKSRQLRNCQFVAGVVLELVRAATES